MTDKITLMELLQKISSTKGGYEDDEPQNYCRHPSHNPPTGLHIPHGKRYRHVCPGCGYTVVLRTNVVSMEVKP